VGPLRSWSFVACTAFLLRRQYANGHSTNNKALSSPGALKINFSKDPEKMKAIIAFITYRDGWPEGEGYGI